MLRRFEKKILIPLPEAPARASMFALNLDGVEHTLTEEDFARLGAVAGGKSGSDIAVACREALYGPLRKCAQAKFFAVVDGEDGRAAGRPDTRRFRPLADYPPCTACVPNVPTQRGGAKAPAGKDSAPCRECGCVRMSYLDISDAQLIVPVVSMEDFEPILAKGVKGGVSEADMDRFANWTREFGADGN